MTDEQVFKKVLDCSFTVHTALGTGLLESAYESCLFYELQQQGLQVERQKILPLVYKGLKVDAGYRIDLLVENKVIIELKAVEGIDDIHIAQVLTYLKLSKCRLGLLVNFNVKSLKYGIKRLILSKKTS